MQRTPFLLLTALSFNILAPCVAASYTLRPIARLGDRLGDSKLRLEGGFWVGALNDHRQIAFVTGGSGGPVLLQFSDEQLTPVMLPGQNGPDGKWPQFAVLWSPVAMNRRGDITFSLLDQQGEQRAGTYLWDFAARQVKSIAQPGLPIVRDQVLSNGGGPSPALNNRGEIALVGGVKNAAGDSETGIFLRGADEKLTPVVLPDQSLPDGQLLLAATDPSLNEAGAIAFLATRKGATGASAYLWEKGEMTPVAQVGEEVAPKTKLAAVWSVRANNHDRGVLVEASVKSVTGAHGLYRWANGKLTAVAIPGQVLDDGETLARVAGGISAANDAGQHVFLATLASHATAAYLLDADGRISTVVKSSARTDLHAISRVGEAGTFGVGLNNHGEVALPVRFSGITGSTLVLLTPR